jgi:alpha-mannosidase
MTETILAEIDRLRSLSQVSIQAGWRYFDGDLPQAEALNPDYWQHWAIAEQNDRNHLPWLKYRTVRWFSQIIQVPTDLQGYPLTGLCLRLGLLWWAEDAQVFVNGQLVQEGDLFDCAPRLLLRGAVTPGEKFAIALRFVSPNHDNGALMKSLCHYEAPSPNDPPEPAFIANELTVLHSYLTTFQPDQLPTLAATLTQLPWHTLSSPSSLPSPSPPPVIAPFPCPPAPSSPAPHSPLLHPFTQALIHLHQSLLPLAAPLKHTQITLLGHAHLDMAWLWTVEETWKAAERTFRSVLNLYPDFPELSFCHTTPALYEWMANHRPDLFAQIQAQVQTGAWEIVAGFWIEPELNLINGESMVRQVLYGQRSVQAMFGHRSAIAWVPDTFGFTWQLPQILRQGGVDYFVTQKLRWNDTSQFPHEIFHWQSPDGTQIFSLMSGPIGEGIDPVKMATFAWNLEQKTGAKNLLWLPGVGDHGGGPTRDMLEVARRWQQSPFFPKMQFGTALEYLRKIEDERQKIEDEKQKIKKDERWKIKDERQKIEKIQHPTSNIQQSVQESEEISSCPVIPAPLPVWNADLYLEYHRGCYTTHGEQKRLNRRSEEGLYEAELWSAIATLTCGLPYPKLALEQAWKQMLLNQFHDILPGSSITPVYETANQAWQAVQATIAKQIKQAKEAIANLVQLPAPPHPEAIPIVVFNSLNWARSGICEYPLSSEMPSSVPNSWANQSDDSVDYQIFDMEGCAIERQVGWRETSNNDDLNKILFNPNRLTNDRITSELKAKYLYFWASDIPALGYRCFWLSPVAPTVPSTITSPVASEIKSEHSWILENEYLRVTVHPETGNLASVFDRVNQREVLSGEGNQLQAFTDQGQYWDAWNIDPNYAQHPLPPPPLESIQWKVQGSLRQEVQVIRILGQSRFVQRYVLEARSPILKIMTDVDWRDRHILVKAAFPLNLAAETAICEIPCAVIERPTKPETEAEKARWEVPAMHWVELCDRTPQNHDQNKRSHHILTDNQQTYGISLLNDSKYGYDYQPNQLRLTLLRGSEWPDPEADKGHHHFVYALYPHAGSWQLAQTVRLGYELNLPLQVLPKAIAQDSMSTNPTSTNPTSTNAPFPNRTLPPSNSLLDLGAENLIMMAFKQSEDHANEWILRCYECHGESAQLHFQSPLPLQLVEPVDLLERSLTPPDCATKTMEEKSSPNSPNRNNPTQKKEPIKKLGPWKIASFKLTSP